MMKTFVDQLELVNVEAQTISVNKNLVKATW